MSFRGDTALPLGRLYIVQGWRLDGEARGWSCLISLPLAHKRTQELHTWSHQNHLHLPSHAARNILLTVNEFILPR